MAYTTINKSTDYFNTKLYTGNGSAGHSITGVGFQPDFVWAKQRGGASGHHLYDALRGVTKRIRSDTNGAETTASTGLTAFGTDGFTVGVDSGVNSNGGTMASWNWKANGAGSANTDGYTNSTVSVNTTAGFSIVKYTGTGSQTTVGHGLGVVPDMMIIRNLSSTEDWSVYHSANGAGYYQALNTTEASSSNNNRFNVAPTSSVFTVNTHHSVNKSGDNHIAYCFAGKTGYSKALSWTANNNNDGVFLYTGFAPSFFIFKTSNNTRDWVIVDNKRVGYNVISKNLRANNANAESNNDPNGVCDFLSNGIKFRTDSSDFAGTASLIGFAFGQSLVGSNNVPCTAR